ncbi:MAG: sensor domain-containing phosphodiesterase [Rhodanobacteraceae bacterium]
MSDPLTGLIVPSSVGRSIDKVLHAARNHLGMDVAFISEFTNDARIFRHVDASIENPPIREGDSAKLVDGYCQRVIDGRLPELIPDTAGVPAALALPETHAIPIGAHIAVPIRLGDGRIYGTFCCFSFLPDKSLNERDLGMLRTLADLVASQLEQSVETLRRREGSLARAQFALDSGQPNMVYQPIFQLQDGGIEGVECLARFDIEPKRAPNEWFAEAASVGLGVQLEARALARAVAELRTVPGDFYIAINCSPQAIVSDELRDVMRDISPQRLVLEITEHNYVDNYALLRQALIAPRASGVRVAIDDTGAGYASMRHILSIDPDIIKLDISLTHNIDRDRRRRALAGAMLEFARHTGSTIIAEGVETAAELATLRELGVREAQGFHFGRPLKLAELAYLVRAKDYWTL